MQTARMFSLKIRRLSVRNDAFDLISTAPKTLVCSLVIVLDLDQTKLLAIFGR